jgi:ATP-dependent Lon protease
MIIIPWKNATTNHLGARKNVTKEALHLQYSISLLTNIMMPHDNQKDFEELADYLKEGLTPHFAKTFDDVVKVAFAKPTSDTTTD